MVKRSMPTSSSTRSSPTRAPLNSSTSCSLDRAGDGAQLIRDRLHPRDVHQRCQDGARQARDPGRVLGGRIGDMTRVGDHVGQHPSHLTLRPLQKHRVDGGAIGRVPPGARVAEGGGVGGRVQQVGHGLQAFHARMPHARQHLVQNAPADPMFLEKSWNPGGDLSSAQALPATSHRRRVYRKQLVDLYPGDENVSRRAAWPRRQEMASLGPQRDTLKCILPGILGCMYRAC